MAEEAEPKTAHQTQHFLNNINTQNETKTETETETELKPWEQHWGVISIPRFDYNAPSSLLNHSHSGFLITCTIKREKSATKEAMSILGKYLGSIPSYSHNNSVDVDKSSDSKRRKTCTTEDLNSEQITDNESNDVADKSDDKSGNHASDSSLTSSSTDTVKEKNSDISLVKLTRSGLLLFTFPRSTSFDVVRAVLEITRSLESDSSTSPQWCHRIFPIQATCILNEMEIRATVSKLVLDFVNDKQNTTARPLKAANTFVYLVCALGAVFLEGYGDTSKPCTPALLYAYQELELIAKLRALGSKYRDSREMFRIPYFAVGYNRRGFEETEMKMPKRSSNASTTSTLLDRNSCFSIVAAAVKDIVPDSVVDLKSPELSVLVELLPLSGVPNGSFVVAVSVLPHNLVSTKPRLCIKPLVSSVKVKGKKQ